MGEYVYGKKLPKSLLTDKEWSDLSKIIKNESKPFSNEFKAKFKKIIMNLNHAKCVGENKNKCIICGEHKETNHTFCNACYYAFYNRNTLRHCGNVRAIKKSELVCSVCGKTPVRAMGLCVSCYFKLKYYNLKDVDGVRAFNAKKKKEKEELILDNKNKDRPLLKVR